MHSLRRLLRLSAFAVISCVLLVGRSAITQQAAAKRAVSAQHSGGLVDINTATAEQLKALPGIGDAYARRIIAGRPYTAKNQLMSRGIVPQAAYDRVQAKIIAKHPAK
jgi:DNA uptake protein ComE-like DNA-binding protein